MPISILEVYAINITASVNLNLHNTDTPVYDLGHGNQIFTDCLPFGQRGKHLSRLTTILFILHVTTCSALFRDTPYMIRPILCTTRRAMYLHASRCYVFARLAVLCLCTANDAIPCHPEYTTLTTLGTAAHQY